VALITQAQWERALGANGAAIVADLTGGNSTVISETLDQASDWVQEFATMAGAPLVAGALTASHVRRVAIAASYFAADGHPEYRDVQGRNVFHARYAQVEAELDAWAKRVRSVSTDDPSEAPEVLSDDARGW